MNKRKRLEAYGSITLSSDYIAPPPKKEKALTPAPDDASAKVGASSATGTEPKVLPKPPFQISPPYRRKFEAVLRQSLALKEDTTLPPFFAGPDIFPAKIGIKEDLLVHFEVDQLTAENKKLFTTALRMFLGSLEYALACATFSKRFDLSNTPVGTLTPEDQAPFISQAHKKIIRREVQKQNRSALPPTRT